LDRIYDLAIIGGGVNGCGIARDAAAINAASNDGEVVNSIQRTLPPATAFALTVLLSN